MRHLILFLYLLTVTTFAFDWYYEGATWHLALLLFVWFLLIVLSRIDLDRMIDRYTAAHIRAAEAQCRMEELP